MAAPEKNKAAERKKLQKSYFDVLGLCCSSEVPLIENILRNLDGVVEFSVIVPTRTVIVLHDHLLLSQLQIAKALNQARLEANVRAYGDTNYKKKWPSPFVVLSGILLLLSLLKYVFHPLRWLALGAVAVGIFPICMKAFASIRSLRLDANILVLIAVVGTIAMKDYTEAGTIVFLFTVAQWLESRASHKANVVMSSLMSIAPQKAVIAETGEEVDADEVKINTVLSVKAGEVIPIDGIVVDGKCEVDEKTLTGESFPVPKEKDSTVWAGTINLNGYISVKTTALAEDCVVAKMANLVEEAQKSKSKTQRFIDKCAQYYTPAIIIISASLAVIPLALRVRNRSYWFHLALVVLVSACPCALILSTPVATFCALMKAATAGLLIKGGEVLETLAKIKIVAFDKTGTITRGEFVVRDFQSLYPDISLNTLLYWVSSIESKSGHPMAAALVDYGRSLSIEPNPENVQDFQNFPGEGICGKIDGKDIYIGNRKIALRAECKSVPTLEDDSKRGKSIGYIYSGANPVGIFCLSDACRSGVAEAIKDLKQLGIRTSMLTGDNQEAAMHAQEELRHVLDVVHAELLPEDKARIIKEFKKEGATAMIGDGLNDAPALATADIGISMGISGSALANETGNVILMSNDIRKVTKVIQLARKAHRKIIENVIFSISTKAAILALAFAGHPLVWAAVLADTGTCLLVILNSMLILRETRKHVGKCCKNSSAQHAHKHVNQLSSHDHKHCCSNTNIEKLCKLQVSQGYASRCESSHPSMNSCKSIKCTDSTKRSDECTDKDGIHETDHCSHGICNTSDHYLELNNPHNHGCSTFHTSSLRVRQKCKNSDWLHEARHCHHHAMSETVTHQVVSDHSTGSDHRKCHSNHCCDNEHTGTKNSLESLGDIVESSCNHGLQPMDHDHDKCCERLSSSLHTAINVQPSENHTETSTMHACMSLEKREIGGCCKSYMKECCGNHGHFAPLIRGSVGGLSEIITE